MMATSLSTRIDLTVSAAELWDAIKHPDIVLKLMPDYITECEYIEGDGGVGSVRLMKFGPAVAHYVTFSKEKIEVLDEAAMKLAYSVIDGELLNYFKFYKVTVTVEETKGGCVVKWALNYETLSPEIPPPEIAKEGAIGTFKALEGYIISTKA